MSTYNVKPDSKVLEIGAARGLNHLCHPNYIGIEYSYDAVRIAAERFEGKANVIQGDATKLSIEDESIDFLFTFATLEHIPNIEQALNEIKRVLKPDGIALLEPAWNCRIWIVQKLPERSYSDLSGSMKIQKLLIPLRENFVFRFLFALPRRLRNEMAMLFNKKSKLHYLSLPVDYKLIERFGHVPDDNAYINIDSHEVMTFFASRGFDVISHKSVLSRLFARGEPIIIKKKHGSENFV